jgi:hypothetical protein
MEFVDIGDENDSEREDSDKNLEHGQPYKKYVKILTFGDSLTEGYTAAWTFGFLLHPYSDELGQCLLMNWGYRIGNL